MLNRCVSTVRRLLDRLRGHVKIILFKILFGLCLLIGRSTLELLNVLQIGVHIILILFHLRQIAV